MSQCKLLVAFGYATPKVNVRGSVFVMTKSCLSKNGQTAFGRFLVVGQT